MIDSFCCVQKIQTIEQNGEKNNTADDPIVGCALWV